MKRILKITLISLLVLFVLSIAGVVIAGYQLLTPSRLTSWVHDFADDHISCQTEIGEVELTVLSTFPDVAIHLKDVSLVNPVEGAQSDTLLSVHDLFASIDIMAFLRDDRIDVKGFTLRNGRINMYVSPDSLTNFNVYISEPDTTSMADDGALSLSDINLQDISVHDFSVTFIDMRHLLEARVMGLSIDLATDVELTTMKGEASVALKADEMYYSDANNYAHIEGLDFENCQVWSDGNNATLKLERLNAADQEYMLSGDVSLLAHIWNLALSDIDLKWETSTVMAEGHPFGNVVTRLDSASVEVGQDDFTYIVMGSTLVNVPVSSTDSIWTANARTSIQHLTVQSDADGMLLNNQDFDTRFIATTNREFCDFMVSDMRTSLGSQTVEGDAHVNIVDSTLLTAEFALALHNTQLSQLLDLVPTSYRPDLGGAVVEAELNDTQLKAQAELRNSVFNITKLTLQGKAPQFCYAEADTFKAALTGVDINISLPKGTLSRRIPVSIASTAAEVHIELSGTQLNTRDIDFSTHLVYDDRKRELLDQFSPVLNGRIKQAHITTSDFPMPVTLPTAQMSFCKDSLQVQNTELVVGNTSLNLTGTLRNINSWLQDNDLLQGRFRVSSPLVDADELLQAVSGLGVADSVMVADTTTLADSDPFMVPMGIDFALDTNVDRVAYSGNEFNQVAGKISVNNGILVLEEMGFTSKAARMQLTALYKSPRRNNLFVGWNFHLLDIDIAEMINLVPAIDTIAPMVKAFAGQAEFHLAGETALFADYSPKLSTLKAVAAIEGQNLTVLDNETFQTIRKYLFKESTTNKIDSLSLELAIARKKMTLYPMLVSWDKYQAVISGNHTIADEMPFNYHISITKCPIVGGHMGLDITGNLEDLDHISYKIGSCRYANLYRPEKRNITQEQTLALKQLISTSLKKTVK